ncbi:MAG: hypothetical protein AUI17_07010 [Acidobacteriales bacterium 13_2_20CM_2_55_5]|nr:MAG: hypothetical protein AUI17_07010 [Acidobacteriales bacterium 13_2_20CM_2_55_5]
MTMELSRTHQYLEILSRLMFRGYSTGFQTPAPNLEAVYPDVEYISTLNDIELADFLRVADIHHVTVRALQVVGNAASTITGQIWARTSTSIRLETNTPLRAS